MGNYNQLIRRWIIHFYSLGISKRQRKRLEAIIPYSKGYIMMANIDRRGGNVEPTPKVTEALRPASDLEAREMELWINNHLKHIHSNVRHISLCQVTGIYTPHMQQYYYQDEKLYKHLLWQWISWAFTNNIPLYDLHNLPYGLQYFWLRRIEKWVTSLLDLFGGYISRPSITLHSSK